ncbi:MAG TPA: anti-sigma regulatory factor [Candidatus Eremiobacteraeota bacterium]|nr:anti-sigma regulatory factor [Candidatus Eremiobacteraeota bacterium]
MIVENEWDIVVARQEGRELARQIGFNEVDQARITTALSELARNIVSYAGSGQIKMWKGESQGRFSICIIAEDNGPGIQDIKLALQDGYSTSKGLGAGLPGVKRLVDTFFIKSKAGQGCFVAIEKILRRNL